MQPLCENMNMWMLMELYQNDSYLLKEGKLLIERRHRRFDNLLLILRENKDLYWPAIVSLIRRNKTQLLGDLPFMKKYPKRFLDKLLRYGCSDSMLVIQILKLYARWLYRIWAGDISFMSGFNKSKAVEVDGSNHICPPLNSGINTDLGCFSDVQMIELALYRIDVKFLTALLKFGVCDIPHKPTKCEYLIADHDLMKFWLARISLGYWNDHELRLIQNSSMNGGDMGNRKRRGFRRVMFMIRVLKIVSIVRAKRSSTKPEWQPNIKERVQCIKLYFRATLEPFISKEDILDFIHLYLKRSSEAFVESVCNDYENLFPEESSTPYGPRRLKHLCRHRFRRHVAEAKLVLPEVVGSLGLPGAMARGEFHPLRSKAVETPVSTQIQAARHESETGAAGSSGKFGTSGCNGKISSLRMLITVDSEFALERCLT